MNRVSIIRSFAVAFGNAEFRRIDDTEWIVRRRNLMRQSAESPWSVNYSVDCFDHEKHDTGVWLPTNAWYKMFASSDGDTTEGKVFSRCDVRCTDWKVNEKIPPEKLQIKFPPGMKVHGLETA